MSYAAVIGGVGALAGAAGSFMAGPGAGSTPSRSLGGEIGAMPIGDYVGQLGDLADAQLEFNDEYAMQILKWLPEFGRAARIQRNKEDERVRKQYPFYTALEREETSKQRGADLRDVQQYGGMYAKLFEELAPGYGKLEAEIDQPRNTEILDKLRGQALYELDLGGRLSADEERVVQQASRAAYASRGMEFSNPALINEVLSREGASRARLGERRNFAGAVQGLEEATSGNRINQLIAATQARLNPILAAVGTRTALSPTISTAATGPAMTPQGTMQTLSGAPQVDRMASAISPLYSYAGQLYGQNMSAAMQTQQLDFQAQQAQASALANLGGGLMSFGSSLYTPT